MSTTVQIPEFDEEFELSQIEDFAAVLEAAQKGTLDTCSMQDVPEGKYTGEIIAAGVQSRTNRKTGEIEPPTFFIQVRCEQHTTTVFKNTNWPRPIFQLLLALLGSLAKYPTPKAPTDMTIRDRVEYYERVAKDLVGKKAEWLVRITTSDKGKFQNFSFAPAV